MRGDGSLFRRGRVFWAVYYVEGERIQESLHTDDPDVAARRLQKLRKAREAGTYLAPAERRVTVGELLDDLVVHLEVRGAASVAKVRSHVKACKVELGHHAAHRLDTATVERAQKAWADDGKAPATVNRRCELLRQAYNLAMRRTPAKVKTAPHVPMLKVQNARQGFLARADFKALLAAIEDADVRDFLEWFWWTGMRPKEIRSLTWAMFDRESWTLNLDPKAAKTGHGRAIALAGPTRTIVERRLEARRLDTPLVFHRVSRGRAGQPVRDFRLVWRAALETAGLPPGLLPYDLRRSALRNLVRGGTDYTVAMKISGHRTRATFDRYNITSIEDTRAAMERTAAYVESLPAERNVAVLKPAKGTSTVRLHSGKKRP